MLLVGQTEAIDLWASDVPNSSISKWLVHREQQEDKMKKGSEINQITQRQVTELGFDLEHLTSGQLSPGSARLGCFSAEGQKPGCGEPGQLLPEAQRIGRAEGQHAAVTPASFLLSRIQCKQEGSQVAQYEQN